MCGRRGRRWYGPRCAISAHHKWIASLLLRFPFILALLSALPFFRHPIDTTIADASQIGAHLACSSPPTKCTLRKRKVRVLFLTCTGDGAYGSRRRRQGAVRVLGGGPHRPTSAPKQSCGRHHTRDALHEPLLLAFLSPFLLSFRFVHTNNSSAEI